MSKNTITSLQLAELEAQTGLPAEEVEAAIRAYGSAVRRVARDLQAAYDELPGVYSASESRMMHGWLDKQLMREAGFARHKDGKKKLYEFSDGSFFKFTANAKDALTFQPTLNPHAKPGTIFLVCGSSVEHPGAGLQRIWVAKLKRMRRALTKAKRGPGNNTGRPEWEWVYGVPVPAHLRQIARKTG